MSGEKLYICELYWIQRNQFSSHLRAILESQKNLITEAVVRRLEPKRKRNTIRIFGLGGNEMSTNHGYVDLCIQPKSREPIVIVASVLTKTTNDFSSRHVNTDSWETVEELQIADPDFNKPSPVDLIIGCGHY